MVASSLLRADSFSSTTSAFAVRQLILLLGGAMSALNTCVDEKEKEATVVHHCLASFAFIAAFVRYLNDDSISADFCRYVMSVLPCITETYGENELIVRDVIVLMKGLSDRVKDNRDCVLVGEVKKEAFENKKVVEDEELKKKVKEEKKEVEEVKEEKEKKVDEKKEEVKEEKKVAVEETTHENVNAAAEEESDDSSYTYESYYSYETVSEEECMEPSMPSLVSAPDMEVLEEKGLTPREEEAWEVEKSEENATSVESKKEEEWGFEDEKEKPEEKEEPVKEEKEEWGFDEEEKTDAKKEEEDWGFDDKEEEKPVVKEEKPEDDDWGFDDEKEKVEKEEPVEEKKEEAWGFEEEKEEKPVKEEKVVEKEEDDWGFEEETEKPTEKKEEKPEEEEKKEPVKEKPTEEKPAEQKPVEEKKEQAASPKKEEVKPAEEKKEEKPAEPAEEKEIKPEASEKTEGSLATALARTEKKLEVDEHLWDDDDEPVKATRTTRRGRKKEKAQTERVVIETPLRSEKLFSDEEEEEERMAKKKARRGRMGRSKKLATFEASWEEEEKPVEKKEPVKEEKPVEKEEKVVEKEPVKEEPVKEEKEEEWGFDEEEKPEEKEEWGFSEEEKKEDDWSFEDEKKPEEEKEKEEKKPVEEAKPVETEKKPEEEAKPVETENKPEEEDWGFDDEKEEEPEEKHEEKEEKDAKEEKPVKEEKKEKEEDWGFDEEKENATVEKEEPTEKAPAEEKKAPAEEQKPSTQTHFTSPSMEVVRTTILTPSTLLLQACRVLDALLSTPVLLAQTCDCFKSYIPAVIADLPLTCYFVEKLVRKVAEKEWKEDDLNAMIEIVTILAAENESVLRSASDLDLELFLEFQKKEDVSSIPKQLVLLLLSFYQTHQQSWLIPIFIHIFTSALSHHTVLQVTRGLQYAVTVLQKLKNEDAQFVIATCGMTIIEAILDVCAVLDKEGLGAMVSFTALLYGKTDKKNEIVELVLHLCAISLKRSLELQPLNVKKCDEDAELVKLNSMIGELLFVMARVNPDSFKQGLQSLPAEKSEMLQNQLRRTVQVKQSESNAARRRNATRMPVKLDASKFTSE